MCIDIAWPNEERAFHALSGRVPPTSDERAGGAVCDKNRFRSADVDRDFENRSPVVERRGFPVSLV